MPLTVTDPRKPLNTLRGIETSNHGWSSAPSPCWSVLENPSTPSGVLKQKGVGVVLSDGVDQLLENPSTPSGVLKHTSSTSPLGECACIQARKPLNTLRGIETSCLCGSSYSSLPGPTLENPSTPSGVLKRGRGNGLPPVTVVVVLENPSTPSGVLKPNPGPCEPGGRVSANRPRKPLNTLRGIETAGIWRFRPPACGRSPASKTPQHPSGY